MKTSLKLLAAALSCSALLPASAQSLDNFIDTAQPVLSRLGGGLGPLMDVGGPLGSRLAQTLTIELGGKLAGVYLPIDCFARPFIAPGQGVIVSVVDVVGGMPGTNVLDGALVDPSNADAGGRFVFVQFTRGLYFSAGDRIALVLENRTGGCNVVYSPASANYPGGHGFMEWLPNPAPLPQGWIALSSHPGNLLYSDDIPFQLVLQ